MSKKQSLSSSSHSSLARGLATQSVKTLPSWREKFVQTISFFLIAGGLILIGFGILIPLRNQIVLHQNQPPALSPEDSLSLADNPLPVVDDSVILEAESTATFTPQPSPTATHTPFPTVPIEAADALQPEGDNLASTISTPTPTATSTPTQTPLPTATPTPNLYPPANSSPTRIVIPAISLDSPIEEAGWSQQAIEGQTITAWDVVAYAVGWHKNSAKPGHIGNIVLSGHHNILGEVFRYIVDLEPGDEITVYADERPYYYVVEDKFIVKDKGESEEVRKANARWIGHFNDQRLTMVTCWPYNSNTHRVIVIAKPVLTVAQQ